MKPRGCTRLAALVASLSLASARAVPPEPAPQLEASRPLEEARVCWAALDLECAATRLAKVQSHLDTLSPAEQREALRLLAEVALASDRLADAQSALVSLLERDPRFSPSGWPAPWLAALEAAKKAAPDRLPPELEVVLPGAVRPREAVVVEVRAHDPGGVARCELVLADGFRVVLLSADGVLFRGEIPSDHVHVPEVLARIEASDRAGNLALWPAQGSQRVLVQRPPIAPQPPITSRWWFWTGLGVVISGAVLAVVLAVDGSSAASKADRFGTLEVVPVFP